MAELKTKRYLYSSVPHHCLTRPVFDALLYCCCTTPCTEPRFELPGSKQMAGFYVVGVKPF